MNKFVKAGEQLTDTISAGLGGRAELVLRAIARPFQEHSRHPRCFGKWRNNSVEGYVELVADGSRRLLKLKLKKREGLFLEDVPGSKFSLRHNGALVLPVGRDLPPSRLEDVANAIVAMVVRGTNWKDRSGREFALPYGEPYPTCIQCKTALFKEAMSSQKTQWYCPKGCRQVLLIKCNGVEREGDPNYDEWRKLARDGRRDDRYAIVFADLTGAKRILDRCTISSNLLKPTLRTLRLQNHGVEFEIEDALEGYHNPSADDRV